MPADPFRPYEGVSNTLNDVTRNLLALKGQQVQQALSMAELGMRERKMNQEDQINGMLYGPGAVIGGQPPAAAPAPGGVPAPASVTPGAAPAIGGLKGAELKIQQDAAAAAKQTADITARKTPHLQEFNSMEAGTIINQFSKFGINDKDLQDQIKTMGSTPGVTKQAALTEIMSLYPANRQKFIDDSVASLLKNTEKDPNYVNTPAGQAHQAFISALDADPTGDKILSQTRTFGPTIRALAMEDAATRLKANANDLVKVAGPDGKPMFVPAGQAAGMQPFVEDKNFSQVIEIPSPDGKTAQKFNYDKEKNQLVPIGQPYSVKSQVTNVNVNQPNNNQVEILAAGILDGTIDPNGISKRGNLQGAVWGRVKELNPSFNIVNAAAGAKFTQSQQTMQTKALLNTIDPLLTKLETAGAILGNSNVPGYNKAVNFLKEQTGSADIVGFNNLRDDVIAEVERGLLGTGVLSDNKYQRALKNVNSAQSLPQLKAATNNIKLVIKTRLESLAAGPNAPVSGTQPATSAPKKIGRFTVEVQ